MTTTLFIVIGAIVLAVLLCILIVKMYVKAPPSFAYIISGLTKVPRVLIGTGGFKIPIFERLDKVFLGQVTVDVKTNKSVPTHDFINVNVDAVTKVRVMPTPEGIRLAAANFLNMDERQIALQVQDSLEGNMREVCGALSLEAINTDRDKFSDQIQSKATPDMGKLGLEIISCNIQNVTDDNNLIRDLGADNTFSIKKNAAITKANAERDIAIAESKAKKEANDVRAKAETEIAERNNELAIRKADLKKASDTKQAEADAAYQIQKEEQRKTIEITTANANIARQEREIELQEKAVQVKERALEAEVKKQAEADKYAAQQKADAVLYQRQKDAEARQFEAQREAEARKAQAEADRFAKEQEAEGIRAVGEAEAKAIEAKGLAEAEAMEKKAEAYAKYNKAAVAEMMIKVLPEIAAQVAAPLQQIDKITIIGGGEGGNGVDQIAGNVPVVMAKVFESMKQATGIDLANIINADSYDAKVNRNINVTGLEGATIVTDKDAVEDVVKDITDGVTE